MSPSARALGPVLVLALGAAAGGARLAGAGCECDPRPLDACFVIDSTGSMAGAIDACKRRIQRLLDLLRENAPRVRVGIVTYRDHGDEYLTRAIELTDDFPRVVAFLKGLQASGGGDTPEAVEAGLEMAYSSGTMGWAARSRKVVVLVGDAPPHDRDRSRCCDLAAGARESGIVTFAVSVEGAVPAFKAVAAAGGGKSVEIQRADDLARHVLALTLDRDAGELEEAFARDPAGAPPRDRPAWGSSGEASRPAAAFVLQQLRFEGDWDPPHARARLLRALRERAGVDGAPDRRVVRATDDALLREPLLYVTGHGSIGLSPSEIERLRELVARGGTILIERCCDGEAFDRAARALAGRVSDRPLVEAGADHPAYASLSRRPVLLEARCPRGRPQVLYSPVDQGCGWSGLETGRRCALGEPDALHFTLNLFRYVLST